jgi:NAD(P) transhydrogenase subunit alpha
VAATIKIAVLRERAAGESRVSATPETVKKFIALGASVVVEGGAGAGASIGDDDYRVAGAEVVVADAAKDADIVLAVQGPEAELLTAAKPGAWVVAGLDPFGRRDRVDAYAIAGLEALAMEFMPRITRAQSWISCRRNQTLQVTRLS